MIRILIAMMVLFIALPAWAARIIYDVSLSPTSVEAGETINASVSVYGTGNGNQRRWKSTGYYFDDGSFHCENHSNYNSNSVRTVNFNITAPNAVRTHYIYFYAYSDNSCNSGRSQYYGAQFNVVQSSLPPTDINLSNSSLYEYQALANQKVGDLSAVDASASDSHSFSILTWDGGTGSGSCPAGIGDHWKFAINGNALNIANSAITAGSYPLCIRVDDNEGNSFRKNLTVTVNSLPSNANFFDINEDEIFRHLTYDGNTVGQFIAADYGTGINFTYSLQDYNGGTQTGSCNSGTSDNYLFEITGGNTLVVNSNALLDSRQHTICVRADSPEGYSIRENFTITVNETPNTANFFDITNDSVTGDNAGVGDTIGSFFNVDDGASLTLTYALNYNLNNKVGSCTGNYNDGNWRFQIDGTALKVLNTSGAANLAPGDYDICVSATDQNGVSYIEDFTISIGMPAQSCPANTGYTDIYTDNFSSNSGNWSAVNFNRSVSSWPGYNILNDYEEDQNVNFTISSGVMAIEGSNGANYYGNNEYGAVLHDLANQNYVPANINEYSIEVDMYADATDINNDVGVVFGYQDTSNYYVLRWTKIGTEFIGNPHGYPGQYRNLDLVKVSNGVATSLDSVANQTLSNPVTLKITVNADGITICIDDVVLLSKSNEQPPIYQYGFFTYENEDGVNFDNLTVQCNGCQQLQCPDTSGFNTIYQDDFSSDSGNWGVNNFNRNVSVWPNELIVNDYSEDQNVDYQISSGYMNIEGSVGANFEGNNEYGAVLHDLSTERYEPENISEYSIEVDMYAPTASSGYLNNDVGVVFGYQNDNNYYVIKWTKYGDRFANEQDYPGEYKNLDLVKVENGVATLLDSVADYDAAYPSRIKITVDANGIVICFDGTPILNASSEQPPIHKYGFFTYENEEGVSFDNLVVKCDGCLQTLICPDTSSYTLIFEDTFANSQNTWTVDDLNRNNVNVWPNDSIYSNNEIQQVEFEIRNGQMDIAGTVSNGGDNEYGVVLHNVSDEGYDGSQITTYSINTEFTSHSDQSNNNDAGVVFGFEDEQNFYVLKWTKYAQNYASNTTFPGEYRALEVIKVVNGAPTQVGVESNFYADDDIDLKITVDDDGITICVNGDNLIRIPSERPALGQVGFFSYDNDYGVSFDNFQVWCQGCSNSQSVDHYRILHPTTGLTCQVHDIVVAACENESCSVFSAETATADLNKAYGTNTVVPLLAVSTENGTFDGEFQHTTSGTITFQLANENPTPDSNYQCYTGESIADSTATNCQMTLADSGFDITTDTLGDFMSASAMQLVTVEALEKSETDSRSCAPSFTGSKPVKIDFTDETAGSDLVVENLLYSTTSNGSTVSVASGTGYDTNLVFNSAAKASFYIGYEDVGQLKLIVQDRAGVLESAEKQFVVYPKALKVELTDGSNNTMGAAGNLTHYAAQPFNFAITAVNYKDDITQNYRPDNLQLAPQMLTPTIDIDTGSKATTFSYQDSSGGTSTLTVNNLANNWQDVSLTFGSTGYKQNSSFNDVGSFSISAIDNYHGNAVSQGSQTAGRFIPYYFVVTESVAGQLESSGNGYSYFGEELDLAVNPQFVFTAKDFLGNTANNYGGYGESGGTFNFASTFAARTYAESRNDKGFNDGDKSGGSITVSEHEGYNGSFRVTLSGDTFTYQKANAPVEAFTSDITLTLAINDLKDDDGIGYCAVDEFFALVDTNCPENYEPFVTKLSTSAAPEIRYGRLRLSNASTSATEIDDIVFVPLEIEYWDQATGRFITNTDDSTTTYNNLAGNLVQGTFTLTDALDAQGTSVFNGKPIGGNGIYLPVVDGSGTLLDGEYELQLDNSSVPDWLKFDWNRDDVIDNNDIIKATVIFGSFSGNNRIIYKRER